MSKTVRSLIIEQEREIERLEAEVQQVRAEAEERVEYYRQAHREAAWTPCEGLWLVERGGDLKQCIVKLADLAGIAPMPYASIARHEDTIARAIAARRYPSSAADVAAEVVRAIYDAEQEANR